MSELLKRLQKSSTIKESGVLKGNKFFSEREFVSTEVPILNIACSGEIDGGYTSSITIIAGASRSFKSLLALLMAKAYMDKYPDAVIVFHDSEFGSPEGYFNSVGIDTSRVLHCPVATLEEYRTDIMNQFNEIKRGEKVFFITDSISNLPSIAEKENAEDGKNTADLQRNKVLKSIFRLINTQFPKKNVPGVVISHSYQTMEMFSKTVVSVGTGGYYAADTIFVITRSQEKVGSEIVGYTFNITVEKSRYVIEKSKLPLTVHFGEGVHRYSGLMDIALESGHVISEKQGWYKKHCPETGEISEKPYRLKQTNTKEFWEDILSSESFNKFVVNKYKVAHKAILQKSDEDIIDSETINDIEEGEE